MVLLRRPRPPVRVLKNAVDIQGPPPLSGIRPRSLYRGHGRMWRSAAESCNGYHPVLFRMQQHPTSGPDITLPFANQIRYGAHTFQVDRPDFSKPMVLQEGMMPKSRPEPSGSTIESRALSFAEFDEQCQEPDFSDLLQIRRIDTTRGPSKKFLQALDGEKHRDVIRRQGVLFGSVSRSGREPVAPQRTDAKLTKVSLKYGGEAPPLPIRHTNKSQENKV